MVCLSTGKGGGCRQGLQAYHDAAPRTPHAEDLISAVEFDAKGEYLATGDRGGRVVIFESSDVASGGSAPVCAPRCRRPSRMGCRGSCRGEGADALPSACRVPRRVLPLSSAIPHALRGVLCRRMSSTASIASSRATSRSSTTSRALRSRSGSTRSGGARGGRGRSSSSRPTTRRSSCGRSTRRKCAWSRLGPLHVVRVRVRVRLGLP